MEYCCNLWDGSANYHLTDLDSIENQAKRLAIELVLIDTKLQTLELRLRVARLSVFYRIYLDECAKELHDLTPPLPSVIGTRGAGDRSIDMLLICHLVPRATLVHLS